MEMPRRSSTALTLAALGCAPIRSLKNSSVNQALCFAPSSNREYADATQVALPARRIGSLPPGVAVWASLARAAATRRKTQSAVSLVCLFQCVGEHISPAPVMRCLNREDG